MLEKIAIHLNEMALMVPSSIHKLASASTTDILYKRYITYEPHEKGSFCLFLRAMCGQSNLMEKT